MHLENDTIMSFQKICEEKALVTVMMQFNEYLNSMGQNTVEKIYFKCN